MRDTLSWILTAIGAITTMVVGLEGSLGLIFGCIFTPSYITIQSQ